MTPELARAHRLISKHLKQIERAFSCPMAVMFIAVKPDNPDSSLLLTNAEKGSEMQVLNVASALIHKDAKDKPADQPLRVDLDEDRVVISMGVNTLKCCADHAPQFYDDELGRQTVLVTDAHAFAHEVVRMLGSEDEVGSSLVIEMFDQAMDRAVDDGCDGVEYRGRGDDGEAA